MTDLVEDLARLFASRWPDARLTVAVPNALSAAVDRDQLNQAIWALLQNAVEAADKGHADVGLSPHRALRKLSSLWNTLTVACAWWRERQEQHAMSEPVPYSPAVERVQPDEAETIRQLEEQFQKILDTTSADYRHAVRAVHAKAHGIAKGVLMVGDGLPADLAQGLFATPGRYEAVLRISTNAGDILDDAIALPRGLALKVLGVEGERLPGSENETTQDFIMVNGPAFAAPDAKGFLKNLTLLGKTTDVAEGGKKALSTVLQATDKVLSAFGIESATVRQLGGAPQVHPLGETYWSQTPFRFGDYIAKWQLVPVSPELTARTREIIDIAGRPDAIREEVRRGLIEGGGLWELRVQLNTDLDAMPIEDATKPWDEQQSPFRTVATLEVPAQIAWEHGESDALDDALSFNVWHGLAAHRPLGGINRARNEPYRQSTAFRQRFNGCPMHEPVSLAELEPAG